MSDGVQPPAGARSAAQWREYLSEYSADVLRAGTDSELELVSPQQRAAGWLGFQGAGHERLSALEQRLGTTLPPSYRAFLMVSDGWCNLGPFMWTMRTTDEVDWLRNAEPELWAILRDDEAPTEEAELADRALLISAAGDGQYWLLDPGDVSADGEWAAHVWSSWSPGFGDRFASFAALVDAERESFEHLSGQDGRPVRTEGVDELVREGIALVHAGEAEAAAQAFERSAVKGSAVGAYLAVIVEAFVDGRFIHHRIRNDILGRPHVRDAIGREQLRAEAVPLFLHGSAQDGASIAPYRKLLAGLMTDDELDRPDSFVAPRLPETAEFTQAMERARLLVRQGEGEQAWAVLEAALPGWHAGDAPTRIAPVILLVDEELRNLVTPARARLIVTTARGPART